MRVRRLERMAVFHDRERMEEAVRDLVDNGLPPNRIRISQVPFADRPARAVVRPANLLAFGMVIGALTGAALTLVWLFWLNELVALPLALPLILQRAVSGAASGGIFGALLAALVLAAHHKDRYELDTRTKDFLVTVTTPSTTIADDVCSFLAFRGGDPVAIDHELPRVSGYRSVERMPHVGVGQR